MARKRKQDRTKGCLQLNKEQNEEDESKREKTIERGQRTMKTERMDFIKNKQKPHRYRAVFLWEALFLRGGQLIQRTEGIAFVFPGLEKFIQNFGVGGAGVMQENHGAVVRARQQFFECGFLWKAGHLAANPHRQATKTWFCSPAPGHFPNY